MKKTLVLTFITSLIALGATAQQYDGTAPTGLENTDKAHRIDVKKLHFGAYVAPTVTWMQPNSSKSEDQKYHVDGNGSKMGYLWGLMADYYFTENYGISTGFNLNRGGGEIITSLIHDSGPVANTVKYANFNYNLQYLDLPFALKLRSDEFKNGLSVFAQIGLTLKINISKKSRYIVNYYDENATYQTASGDNEILRGGLSINPILLEMNVGGGIEYPITDKLSFYTGIFFNNGFLPDVTNPENYSLGYNGSFKDANTRLNNFALRVGIFF